MALPQSLKAACFDLDGTLIDTGPLHVEAERLALASLGILELAEDHPVTFGTGVMPGIQILVDHYNLPSIQHVFDAYLSAWESVFETGLQPMIGADEALRTLASRNVPLALVTSGEDEYVDAVLARFNWTSLFAHRVTLESVKRLKPDPEPYLLAAKLLGLEPEQCAGFEDSTSGLRAMKASNVFSVIVRHDYACQPELAEADMAITGLDTLDNAAIDQLFG